jgi:hypothetical protein
MDTKIIILTPVKNEDWILEQFLTITSFFADNIIIADQQSTDRSKEICSKYDKVHVIENKSNDYDEASRQTLLIETARQLFPGSKRIFFCLDADELFSANSLLLEGIWKQIKELTPGTSIYMEKPDILFGTNRCVRWKNNYFPIGYVDDGIQHRPVVIHSKRIPDNPAGESINIDEIKILHFAHSRKKVQSAKLRYYSVIENIKHSKPFYLRRYAYSSFYNEAKNYPPENIETLPFQWIKDWDEKRIELRHFNEPDFSWHDYEVLSLFKNYGYKSFYTDNIWDFNWEEFRKIAIQQGRIISFDDSIKSPPLLLKFGLKIIDVLYIFYRKLLANIKKIIRQ